MGRYTGKKCRLMAMFSLTASFFLVEIIVGHVTNSMALIADSFHMLSDIAALVIAFISVKMAPKSWDKNTYGWARAEVLGKTKVFSKRFCLRKLFLVPFETDKETDYTYFMLSYRHDRRTEKKYLFIYNRIPVTYT